MRTISAFVLAFTVLGITSFARPKLENSEEAKYSLNKDEKRYSVTKILIFMAIAIIKVHLKKIPFME